MTELKNLIESFKNRLNQKKKIVTQKTDFEVIQSEKQKQKSVRKKQQKKNGKE